MDVQEQGAADGAVVPPGLTHRAAEALRRRGEGNTAVRGSSRGYARILRAKVSSFFTTIPFVIGAALLVLGRYNDAFTSVGLGLVNAAISAVQGTGPGASWTGCSCPTADGSPPSPTARTSRWCPEEVVRGDVLHLPALLIWSPCSARPTGCGCSSGHSGWRSSASSLPQDAQR